MIWIGILAAIAIFVGLVTAVEKLRFGEHEEISWFFFSFGMYTWFQVVVLSPFWLLFSVACMFWWPPATAIKAYLMYHTVRSSLEIVLTQNHENKYVDKMIPALHQIAPHLGRQMYAIVHVCIIVTCLYFLSGIFN